MKNDQFNYDELDPYERYQLENYGDICPQNVYPFESYDEQGNCIQENVYYSPESIQS